MLRQWQNNGVNRMGKKSSKRYGIRNIYGKEINVDGTKLQPRENRMVDENQEIKNLIKHGYVEKVTEDET